MKALIILVCLLNTGIINEKYKWSGRIAAQVQNAKSEEEIIRSIRQKYLAINGRLKSLKKVSRDVPDLSNEGGEVTGYYEGKILKKSVLVLYGEMGQIKQEYYFDQDKLIFELSTLKSYDKPMYIEGSKIKSTADDRFYLEDRKLIRWIKPNAKQVHTKSDEFKQKELELVGDLERMKNFLTAKK